MFASAVLAGDTPSASTIPKWLTAFSSDRWQFRSEARMASTDQRVILWIRIGRSPIPSALRTSASTFSSDCARGSSAG